jgi:hypothetical protein
MKAKFKAVEVSVLDLNMHYLERIYKELREYEASEKAGWTDKADSAYSRLSLNYERLGEQVAKLLLDFEAEATEEELS